ncbi:uncharacterized protein EAF01_001954 [Botrytis porri]|uniref:uncharacterized protein n=1 Tax=Botrytis porri TaxID=87229 RepID=UPI001902AD0F|nr:uncharacterized protein EAF01_001954 [Botrytis porri]KAF7912933.1 hypothetical protein EAF01_001954 [Botrytis porri]
MPQIFGNPRMMESKALLWNASRVPLRCFSLDENTQSLGELKHKDRFHEVDSGSPTPISSSLASPEPMSSEQNDDLQVMGRSLKAIIDESCLMKGAPSCDKAKAKFDELGKDFPSDLPYIITYEHKYLEAICQECDRGLRIEGSALGGIMNHATGIQHGLNVKQRLVLDNLEEALTSKVMARRKAMETLSEPNSCREVQNQPKSKNEKPWELPSIKVDPTRPVEHFGPEPRKSKRQKLAPALLAETDTGDLRVSTVLKNPVGRSRGWKRNKEPSSITETSALVSERIAVEISESFTDFNHQFDHKMKKQRDQILLLNADLIGLRNFYGKRLDTLEQISETRKHELIVNNRHLIELKAQNDASFQKDKVSLADMKSTLGKRKESIDNLTNLLSNAECKLESQKNFMKNMAVLFPGVESKLNEQIEIINRLSSRMESDLEGQKATTTDLDSLRLHTEKELQTHQKQIAKLEQKISGIQHVVTKEVSGLIKKQSFPHVAVDRVEKLEKSIEEINKRLEDPFPARISEAIVDRVVRHTAEKHNRLEEMGREIEKRHSSQRASFIEVLETKMTCTSQATIDPVANLEGSLEEFQTKLTGMACLAVEPQLQCCKQDAEVREKQAVEFRPYMDRIVRLEEDFSDSRSLKYKLDSLERCTQGFQIRLDEMACESAEYRLQQDSVRTESLKRQALES